MKAELSRPIRPEPVPPNFRSLPLKDLKVRANIRRHFEAEQLAELTESVKRDGRVAPAWRAPTVIDTLERAGFTVHAEEGFA